MNHGRSVTKARRRLRSDLKAAMAIQVILRKADVECLIREPIGCPPDEYDSYVDPILSKIRTGYRPTARCVAAHIAAIMNVAFHMFHNDDGQNEFESQPHTTNSMLTTAKRVMAAVKKADRSEGLK